MNNALKNVQTNCRSHISRSYWKVNACHDLLKHSLGNLMLVVIHLELCCFMMVLQRPASLRTRARYSCYQPIILFSSRAWRQVLKASGMIIKVWHHSWWTWPLIWCENSPQETLLVVFVPFWCPAFYGFPKNSDRTDVILVHKLGWWQDHWMECHSRGLLHSAEAFFSLIDKSNPDL